MAVAGRNKARMREIDLNFIQGETEDWSTFISK